MKVIIAGGRNFNNYVVLKDFCDTCLKWFNVSEIVSGGAAGADKLGEQYAKENKYPVKIFKAQWDEYGKGAGPIRNHIMADYADTLIAFWDGKSKGTKNMIDEAKKQKLQVFIYPI